MLEPEMADIFPKAGKSCALDRFGNRLFSLANSLGDALERAVLIGEECVFSYRSLNFGKQRMECLLNRVFL